MLAFESHPEISFEQALMYCQARIKRLMPTKELSDIQQQILQAAWDDVTYDELAQGDQKLFINIQHRFAPDLWRLLEKVFYLERVSKKSFKTLILLEMAKESQGAVLSLEQPTGELRIYGNPPSVSHLYGREAELHWLESEVVQSRCILITGEQGIGKSWLLSKFIRHSYESIRQHFDCVVWQSNGLGSSLEVATAKVEQSISLNPQLQGTNGSFIEVFKKIRGLIILDDVEQILQFSTLSQMEQFIYSIAEQWTASCLILASQSFLEPIKPLRTLGFPVNHYNLKGLSQEGATSILNSYELMDEPYWAELIKSYRGNPHLLTLAAESIQSYFGGQVSRFKRCQESFAGDFFQESFNLKFGTSLNALERSVLKCLTDHEKSITLETLIQLIQTYYPVASMTMLIKAIEHLEGEALLEVQRSSGKEPSFNVPASVKKYVVRDPLKLITQLKVA